MRGMNYEDHSEIPVLIVGAGAAGLTTAVALARQGVESLLVERGPDLSALPRATAISTRSMELFRSWGLEEEIRAGGTDGEWLMWLCETLAQASAGSALPGGYPTKEQSAVVSPTGPAIVPQDHLEPVLLRHLALARRGPRALWHRLGRRRGQAGWRSGSAARRRDRGAANGPRPLSRGGRWRAQRGPARPGYRDAWARQPLSEAVTALFRAPLWDLVGDHRYGSTRSPSRRLGEVFFPAGLGDGGCTARIWEPGAERLADFTEERLGRHPAGAGSATSGRKSSGSATSPSPRSWRSASGAATRSSSATPPTG